MILTCTTTVVAFVLAVPAIFILKKGEEFVEELSDGEEDFIDRAVNPRLNSRLGCQCVLLENEEGEIEVTLPDQTQFLGE